MAPHKPVKKGGGEVLLQSVLDLAGGIVRSLNNREEQPATVERDVERHIKRSFPLSINSNSASKVSELDAVGCDLWNAATNVVREDVQAREHAPADVSQHVRLPIILRAFACLLIDSAHRSNARRSEDASLLSRTSNITLKAAAYCLDQNELGLALKLLATCAEHVAAAETDSPLVRMVNEDDDPTVCKQKLSDLTSRYYLLRMKHAWKSDRIDLAEHFFNKYTHSSQAHVSALAESVAAQCLEAAKALKKRASANQALVWLERGLQALDECDMEQLSMDAPELRLSIAAELVDGLVAIGLPEPLLRAEQVVEELIIVHGLGNRMAVQLLHIKISLHKQPVNLEAVSDDLLRLIRAAVLTDRTFRLIMKAIHRAQKRSDEVACDALDQLVSARILPDIGAEPAAEHRNADWLEQACVTYTVFGTGAKKNVAQPMVKRLEALFNTVMETTGKSLSPKATHAIQTLIWQRVDRDEDGDVEAWCALLRHPLFDSAGYVNKAKIGRRAINLALSRNNLPAARAAFFDMPSSAQNESVARYLGFKIAIRSDDYDFALECLQVVLKHADRDATFLYACALEAQQSQMRPLAVAALQAILDKRPPGSHLLPLLRCIARLLLGELDRPIRELDVVASEVASIFQKAASSLLELRKDCSEDQWRSEIQWWSKNAYNVTVKQCGQIHPKFLVCILQSCVKFIEAYPRDGGVMNEEGIRNRQTHCHFLSAAALIVLARSQDEDTEESLQCYLQVRKEVAAFRQLVEGKHNARTAESYEQHESDHRRLFELQKFDLESILNMRHWNEVSSALEACLGSEHVDSWDTLADIVLIIHQECGHGGLSDEASTRMMELLDRIINDTWSKHKDIMKASRWLRLSFSLDLSDGDGTFALKLLAQAAQMAKKQQSRRGEAFPETELQWLAITAFNHAVDLLSGKMYQQCLEWTGGALELARYASDQGALHANLTEQKAKVEAKIVATEALCSFGMCAQV